jgi:hypothetical protein
MVAFSGMQLAYENQSGFGEIFDYIAKGEYLAVRYPKDSISHRSMAAQNHWQREQDEQRNGDREPEEFHEQISISQCG